MTPALMAPQCPMPPWKPREQLKPADDLRREFVKALVMGSAALMLTAITGSVTYLARILPAQHEQLRDEVAIRNAQYMARFQAIEETLGRAVRLLDNMEIRLREEEQK